MRDTKGMGSGVSDKLNRITCGIHLIDMGISCLNTCKRRLLTCVKHNLCSAMNSDKQAQLLQCDFNTEVTVM